MSNNLIDGVCHVRELGYRWVESLIFVDEHGDPTNRFRLPKTKSSKPIWAIIGEEPFADCAQRAYAPLEANKSLFLEFAELKLNRNAALAFANKYGLLGYSVAVVYPPTHTDIKLEPNAEMGPGDVAGETWEFWARSISNMKKAVRTRNLLADNDRAGLLKHFVWREDTYLEEGWHYCDTNHEEQFIGFTEYWTTVPNPELGRNDVFLAAKLAIQMWTNEGLQNRAFAKLVYDASSGQQFLKLIALNLLGAMWLQFGHAYSGKKQFRTCRECGSYFEISIDNDGRSARRVFCDEPCKSRDYRRRKDKAICLRREGQSLKNIANELGTDISTIKRWSKAKGKGTKSGS